MAAYLAEQRIGLHAGRSEALGWHGAAPALDPVADAATAAGAAAVALVEVDAGAVVVVAAVAGQLGLERKMGH